MHKTLIIAIILLSLFACKENYVKESDVTETKKVNIPAVKVAAIALTKEPIPIEASGTIGSKAEINLSFKIGGIIDNLYVNETQYVRKGQVLGILRRTEINAQVKKAQQAVDKWERDLSRIKKMYADTVATLENVEDISTQLEVAKSDLEIAQFNQQYATIKSPVNGKVLKRFFENTELISPGTPVYRIATTNEKGYVLNIGVADKDVISIKLGDKASVIFDAHPTETFQAYVSEIAEAADPRTGVFPIELTVNSRKGKRLKNGFIGKVKLYPSNQAAYIKIPMNALVEGYQKQANLYTIQDGLAKKITIQPTYIGNDFFTVSENQLTGITEVITDGAAYLKEGIEVKINQ